MSLGHHASVTKFNCESLSACKDDNIIIFNPNPSTFVSFGTQAEGEKAYIRTDGTCSFVNQSALNFSGLCDVPNGYSNQSGKVLGVNKDELGLEFMDTLNLKSINCEDSKINELSTQHLKSNCIESNKAILTDITNTIMTTCKITSSLSNLGSCFIENLENNGNEIIKGSLTVNGASKFGDVSIKSLSVDEKILFGDIESNDINCENINTKSGGTFNFIKANSSILGKTILDDTVTKNIKNTSLITTNTIEAFEGKFLNLGTVTLSASNIKHVGDIQGVPENPIIFNPENPLKTNSSKLVVYGVLKIASPSIKFILETSFPKVLTTKEIKVSFQIYDDGNMIIPLVNGVGVSCVPNGLDTSAQISLNFSNTLTTVSKFVLVISLNEL